MSDEEYGGGGGGLFGWDLGGGVFDPAGAGTAPPLAEPSHPHHPQASVSAQGEAAMVAEAQRAPLALPPGGQAPMQGPATKVSPGLPFDPAALERAARAPGFAPAPQQRMHPQAMRRGAPQQQFGEETPAQTSNLLGLALVLIPVAAAIGWKVGGATGALGGGLVGGALVNAWRAAQNVTDPTPAASRETVVSATYAVVGLGGGGYLLYRGSRPYAKNAKKRAEKNVTVSDEDDDDFEDNGSDSLAPDSPHRI